MTEGRPILTVGHSTRSIEELIALLRQNGVTAIADVRSTPFSRWTPQFNREALQKALKAADISYVFLGAELGARSDDPSCYVADKVQYRRLAATAKFQAGIDRLAEGRHRERIAVLCAEGEPLDCHRTILVARELIAAGATVSHILPDGSLEPHDATMRRLMQRLHMLQPALLESPEDLLDRVYAEQESRIAYVRSRGTDDDE